MDLAALFTDAGIEVPTGHATLDTVALPEALLNVGIGIISTAVERGVDLPDAPSQLRAARNAERAFNAISTLRTQLIAKADQTGAAEIDGLSMADVIAEERRIPKDDATSQIRKAVARTAFPNALAAAAASRISQDNLDTAVATLTKLRPHYSEAEFGAVEQALLKEAEGAIPAAFKRKCRTTLELLDETLRRANNAATAKRRRQIFDDRGITIKLIEEGEFGAQIWGTIPPEYLRILMPALDTKAEAIARAQRHSNKSRKAADRRIRLLDAIFTLATGNKPPALDDLDTRYGTSDVSNRVTAESEDCPTGGTSDVSNRVTAESEDCPTGGTSDVSNRVPAEPEDRPTGSSNGSEKAEDTDVSNGVPAESEDCPTGSSNGSEKAEHTDGATDRPEHTNCAGSNAPGQERAAGTAATATDDSGESRSAAREPMALSYPERTRHLWDTTSADLARTARLASTELRKLLALRDGGCVFPMCTDPPERCIAHHIKPWDAGGETNVRNLALVCSRHHRRVEHPPGETDHWTIIIDGVGLPAARPPRRIDPHQQPIYHPRLTSPACIIPMPGELSATAEAESTAAAGTERARPNNVGDNAPLSRFELANDWRFDQKLHGPPPF